MFVHVPFHLKLFSTNRTALTLTICLSICKIHLEHCNVKCVENILRKYGESQDTCKKAQTYFGFPVEDLEVPDIFYQIKKFLISLVFLGGFQHHPHASLNPLEIHLFTNPPLYIGKIL